MPASAPGTIERPRRLTDMIPIDQHLNPAQIIIGRNQIIQTNHLNLPGLFARPDRKRRECHTHSVPVPPDETSTGS